MVNRPRRLRQNAILRHMVRETRVSSNALIYPLFVKAGTGIRQEIKSLPGQYQLSPDQLPEMVEECLANGVDKLLLFGIPKAKDEMGSGAYAADGIVQEGVRAIREAFGNRVYIITDVCMCEYTSHGHCGIVCGQQVDNDKTLPYIARTALSHAVAGADMVAPSDMMDGRIAAIRSTLDENGFEGTPIMSYAVKYASSYYGPFRDAAGSAPSFGDRRAYQMDYHNSREGLKEAFLDAAEGADILMVKPALAYLDIISEVKRHTTLPLCTYSVSGEYAMIKSAAAAGLIDEYGIMCESAVAMFRAGADMLITYYAKELANAIHKGDIG